MSTNLGKGQGVFDPSKRYAFTNIMESDFTFSWNSEPIVVRSGETVELPEYLAFLATGKIVDQIMLGEEDKKTKKIQETRPDYKAPNVAGNLGIPAARKVWEDKVLKELPTRLGTDARLDVIRAQARDQFAKDLSAQPAQEISSLAPKFEEFAEIKPSH